MILSVRAGENILLLALPAESMILSALPEQRWATPVAQWAAGRKAIALEDGMAVAQWTAQCRWSRASDEVTFLYVLSDLCFFLLK